MGVVRGITRPVLFFALVAVIASGDVAEGNLFASFFNKLFKKVETVMQKVTSQAVKKFSVLSSVFGDGLTRGDLSLGEIINGAFSRNNAIFVGNGSAVNTDWQLGDGTNYIGAISTGGSVSVTNNGGQVTITTGKQPNAEKIEEEEQENENENEILKQKCAKGKEGKECRQAKRKARKEAENAEKAKEADEMEKEKTNNGTISGSGDDIDGALFNLMENWEDFVTSSIWDSQDGEEEEKEEGPMASAEEDIGMEVESRVINGVFFGNGVPAGSSFTVKFFYNNEENFYCSGSLIGYPYVLTAAHCGVVVGDTVRVGGRMLRSGYEGAVEAVILHPEFEAGSLVHDVAVVKLSGLADKASLMENGVKAARINKDNEFPGVGFVGVLSGHGSVESDGSGASDKLRTTRHGIYGLEKCQEEITQGDLGDDESYLCAGDGERSTTCVGDSGGGLWRYRVMETAGGKKRKFYEIFGVVSFGEVTDEALCPRGPPTVFQKTSSNYRWIVDVVGKENMP